MRILLIGNYPPDRQESMLRFAEAVASGLVAIGDEARILQPKSFLGRLPIRSLKKWLGYFDKYLLFPRTLVREQHWADVVHIMDHSNAMYGQCITQPPFLTTCNDLLAIRSALGEFPQNRVRFTGRKLQFWIARSLKVAPRIACISEATRQDLFRLLHVPPERATVIHMDLHYPYRIQPEARVSSVLQNLTRRVGCRDLGRFLLHIGGNVWYKNREGVLRIFAALGKLEQERGALQLVMAGQPLPDSLQTLAASLGISDRIINIGEVSNDELEVLYNKAECLLFPSWAEGFGWPIVEAQACGCPVITSNIAPMPEVGGEGAIYISPAAPAEAARLIAPLLTSARSHLADKGFANAARFSSGKMVEAYRREYAKLSQASILR